MKVYLLEFFTGAANASVHSALVSAKAAFATYVTEYHADGDATVAAALDLQWHAQPYDRWICVHKFRDIADITITAFEVDAVVSPV